MLIGNFYKHPGYPLLLFFLLAVPLLASFIVRLPAPPVMASADDARWVEVNIPGAGADGDWVLADGSDIQCLAAAPDGTLYAHVTGLTDTLYKSDDGGSGWSPVGGVSDAIVGIAVSPVDAATVYYATLSLNKVVIVSTTFLSSVGTLNLSSIVPSL